jgi:hypothetical protein
LRIITAHEQTHFQKLGLGVALQAPLLRVAAVVGEEHGEHFSASHHAQELGVVAELHVVVRARGRRAGQAIRHALNASMIAVRVAPS